MNPLIGFAPDLDPTTPGAVIEGTGFVGSTRGIKGSPSWRKVASLYDRAQYGAAVDALMVGGGDIFIATSTHVIRAQDTVTIQVTDVTPSGYTGGLHVSFKRFGAYIILAGHANSWHWLYGSASAFTAMSVAQSVSFPHYSFYVRAYQNEWFTSDIGDATDWTIGVGSQAQSGTFADSDGNFYEGESLGQYAVMYKSSAIWIGRYVGAPLYWAWEKVPSGDGCTWPGSLLALKDAHYYFGEEDIYRYTLGRPESIGGPVKRWLFDTLYHGNYRARVAYEPVNELIYWFVGGDTSEVFTDVLTYHIPTARFGRDFSNAEAVVRTTLRWNESQAQPSLSPRIYMIRSGELFVADGAPGAASLTMAQYGNDDNDIQINRVRARFSSRPEIGGATHSVRDYLDGDVLSQKTSTDPNGRYDFGMSGKWHQDVISVSGDWEMLAYGALMPQREGRR